ncbi:hypothetical protein ACFQZT_03215 [Paenibacillus sp. GCM10027628]|uniref:hypothetical protein n=1 Tax=Paenibacillus sp. GCM10027628 TaxID=3273413 RepID=UPI00363DC9F8
MPNPSLARTVEPVGNTKLMTIGAEWGLAVSLGLIGSIGILYISSYLILLTRLPFRPLTIISVAMLMIAGLLLWGKLVKQMKWRSLGATLLLVGVFLVLSVWVSGLIYDTSFDGQGYHQLAAYSIHNGWNPFYQPDYLDSIWVKHYPKGIWVLAAAIYSLTGHLEYAKAINLILMTASFCAVLGALMKVWSLYEKKEFVGPMSYLHPLIVFLVAACAACNPVTVVQLLTNYNDGAIASLLLTLISAGIYYVFTFDRRALAIAAIAVGFLVNIKFTAIAYAGLICAWLVVTLIILELRKGRAISGKSGRRLLQAWKQAPVLRAISVLLCSALIGLLVFGWNPYVTNTLKYGHPFYPLAGNNALDIMTLNSPDNFIGHSRFKTFLLSLTSKTDDVITPASSARAELWPIPWDDFQKVNVDTRVAGFGPLSPWILIGSACLWALLCVFRIKKGVVSTLLILALLTTVFINPEPWWVRYVPQLWLVPLIIVIMGWWSQQRFVQAIALLLLFVCCTDALKSADFIFHLQVRQSEQVRHQLSGLEGKQLTVYPNGFISLMVRLKERDIAFTVVADQTKLRCLNPVPFAFTPALYCESTGE